MRTVDKVKAPMEYFKYFQTLITSRTPIAAWQVDEKNRTRCLYRFAISAARKEEDFLKADFLEKNKDLELAEDQIYFYAKEYRLLFKASKQELEHGKYLNAKLPQELRVLGDIAHKKIMSALAKVDPARQEEYLDYSKRKRVVPEFEQEIYGEEGASVDVDSKHPQEVKKEKSQRDKDIFEQELSFISLDEEDKIYADKRDAPRARPPAGKKVVVEPADGSGHEGSYSLFDLSRGGLAILVFSENAYEAGQTVHIKAFDDKVLDEPMVAEVKSVRPADEQGMQFKVGLQFL